MTNGNDLAFAAGASEWREKGLTKREYFAAMAMQGILSIESTYQYISKDDIALSASQAADALINALNDKP
jgi:hypothetical protein